METGYAIVTDCKIDVSSVQDSARGAKVNWLFMHTPMNVHNKLTDEEIHDAFASYAAAIAARGEPKPEAMRVTITVARDEQSGG